MLLNSATTLVLISIQCLIVVSDAASVHENVIDTGCHNDGDCTHFAEMNQVANSTCLNHQCVCTDSDFKTIACFPEKQKLTNVIGGKCPCTSIQWSSCVDGLCMCKPDYVSSNDKRSCVPNKVRIGSRCENNAQCSKETAVAMCVNNTCTCSENFIFHNGTCHSLIAPVKCANGTNCTTITNSFCVQEHCYCEPGYVAAFDKSTCLPNADFNGNCSESGQCQHRLGLHGVCELGKCVCQENYVKISFNDANNGTKTICEEHIAIGQPCTYDTDCFQSHFNGTEQSMYCYLKECQCAQDYELDANQRVCKKSKIAELQSTWLDSILAKVSSIFATSSGNQNTFNYFKNILLLIICYVLLL